MRYVGNIAVFLLLLMPAGAYAQDARRGESISAATGTKQDVSTSDTGPAAKGGKRFVATTDRDNVQHVEIVAGDYYFEPDYIVVRANVPVELKVKKVPGIVPHDFVINAPEAGIVIKTALSDDWKTFFFTPGRAGKFEMYCDKKLLWFKSHKDRGMDGYVEVVP